MDTDDQAERRHHIENDPGFELISVPAPAHLRGIVVGMVGYRECRRMPIRQCEPASLVLPLIVSFADPFSIGLGRRPGTNESYASFAAGLFAGPVFIESEGGACCLQIDFSPSGARRFFGLPLDEIASRMMRLDDVLGNEGQRLREALGNEPSWDRRFAIAADFVTARLAYAPMPDPRVDHLWRQLRAGGGQMTVGALARQVGWSRKHLAERFRDQVGLGPKAVARIMRFRRAAACARDARAGWAEIAAECGYADQAHLAREFRALAGVSPSEWRAG